MTARFSRRVLLISALLLLVPALAWFLVPGWSWGVIGTPWPLGPIIGADNHAQVFANSALFVAVMLLAQWVFLRPVRRSVRLGGEAGRPRWHALLAVAFIATLLTTAVIATVLEWPDWWADLCEAMEWWIFLPMGVVWLVWSAVFLVYFKQGDFLARAERVVRVLIRGSCLELLVAIPTHAFVYRRDDDCYCVRGSYTGIVFGLTVLLWAFGPGLVLLAWREKQRREPVLRNLCPKCGTPLAPAGEATTTCPTCGHRTSGGNPG